MNNQSLDQLRIERAPEDEGPGRTGRALLWVLCALVVLGAAGAWYWLQPDGTEQVTTAAAREVRGDQAATVLNASGYVTARRQATVSSKITGKVVDIPIEEGMEVAEGQVLARLDDTNARAALELAEAQARTARTSLIETEALLEEARLNLGRTRNLAEKNLASEAELDRNLAQTRSLEARLERNRADVVVAERQIDIYRQQLEDTIIRAPFDGVVVGKNAQPGEMISPVSAGGGFTRTGIGTIVDMSSLEIEIDVSETYINRVSPGQKVVASLDAYPDWQIPGHVVAIVPTADRQRATVGVRVGFDDLDPRILPDMGVNVSFRATRAEDVDRTTAVTNIAVPAAAVRGPSGSPYVYVVHNGVVERRAVKLGARYGDDVFVDAGLAAGERVVVEGPAHLTEGSVVREPGA